MNQSSPALSGPKAAAYLGITHARLYGLRQRGLGPAFYNLDGRVSYRKEDLDAWMEACRVQPGAVK